MMAKDCVKENECKNDLKRPWSSVIGEFLTVEELAETLKISKSTAYAMVRSGQIQSVKIGVQYRIPAKALITLAQ